nr:MAG TPA: hypothetical protein [Caudoviricetes sp.]
MYKRYSGEFLSRKNVCWRVDIYQEAKTLFENIGELQFPAESPLTLEWAHTDKEEVICGSTATLQIVSPGDRTYEDLYIIAPGTVRMDVYRNGVFYWSGTLDPEFYEEPYAYFNEYEVNLTFSDFGILDRFKYTLAGTQNLQELVEYALAKSGIRYGGINQQYITTSLTSNGEAMALSDLSIRSDNFYDEDGEANSLYEMLENILQPLGLRIMQKGGTIWVYDLNGLYLNGTAKEIVWADEDQVMGTDKVINNAKITFSPYAKAETLANNLKYEGEYSEEQTNLWGNKPGWPCYSYFPDYDFDVFTVDQNNISFTIFLSDQGSGLAESYSGSRFFHIQPMLGGQEEEGMAYSFYTGGQGSLASGGPERCLNDPSYKGQNVLMRTIRIPIQALEETDQKRHYLRLSMEMMLDMRYNPFTDANDKNEQGNQELAGYRFNYVRIPATVTLYSKDGIALKHYNNEEVSSKTDLKGQLSYLTEGKWKDGPATYQSCWLVWYNPEDRHTSSGVLGWKKNRHNIGLSLNSDNYVSFKKLSEGQYMPYPPQGGYLEVCIYTGIWIYEWTKGKLKEAPQDWYDKIRWLLYKAPTVEMVRKNITHSSAESEDIEYNGVINENAKDSLELNTTCGTATDTIPSAKGIYLRTADGLAIKTLTRGGRTTQAEQLLIGTLYSQFADRKTKLEGTAEIASGGLYAYMEGNQQPKRFVCLSDVQNVIADESEMEIVEFRPDEYKAENE